MEDTDQHRVGSVHRCGTASADPSVVRRFVDSQSSTAEIVGPIQTPTVVEAEAARLVETDSWMTLGMIFPLRVPTCFGWIGCR